MFVGRFIHSGNCTVSGFLQCNSFRGRLHNLWRCVEAGFAPVLPDLPYIAYQDILLKSVQRVFAYKQGVKWINLTTDIRAFWEYRRRGQLGLGRWLASLMGVRSYAYFAWDDLAPALLVPMDISRKIFGILKRRNC